MMGPLRSRTLLATAVAALTLCGVTVAPALAGSAAVELSSDIDCDTTAGEWVVTYTFRSNGQPGDITGSYILSGGPSGETAGLVFTPSRVTSDEPAISTIRLPGSSLGLLAGSASNGFASDEVEDQLDGSCQVTPASSSTTTTTVAADPQELHPAFTG